MVTKCGDLLLPGFVPLLYNSDEDVLKAYARPGDVRCNIGGGVYVLMRPVSNEVVDEEDQRLVCPVQNRIVVETV